MHISLWSWCHSWLVCRSCYFFPVRFPVIISHYTFVLSSKNVFLSIFKLPVNVTLRTQCAYGHFHLLQTGASISNHLLLNVDNTKEMVTDFSRKGTTLRPLRTLDREVEVIKEQKYLGVTTDNQMNWRANNTSVYGNGRSRLYFPRKLTSTSMCAARCWR